MGLQEGQLWKHLEKCTNLVLTYIKFWHIISSNTKCQLVPFLFEPWSALCSEKEKDVFPQWWQTAKAMRTFNRQKDLSNLSKHFQRHQSSKELNHCSSPTCPPGSTDLFKRKAVNSNPPTAHSSPSLEPAEPWYHPKKPKSSTAARARLQLTQGHFMILEGD